MITVDEEVIGTYIFEDRIEKETKQVHKAVLVRRFEYLCTLPSTWQIRKEKVAIEVLLGTRLLGFNKRAIRKLIQRRVDYLMYHIEMRRLSGLGTWKNEAEANAWMYLMERCECLTGRQPTGMGT